MVSYALVTRRFKFNSAHFLPGYDGKCQNLHGHTWYLEVAVEGRINGTSGMVMDFSKMKQIVNEVVIERLDHHCLNDLVSNPTAENLCELIWGWLKPYFNHELTRITVYEDPDCWITYTGRL